MQRPRQRMVLYFRTATKNHLLLSLISYVNPHRLVRFFSDTGRKNRCRSSVIRIPLSTFLLGFISIVPLLSWIPRPPKGRRSKKSQPKSQRHFGIWAGNVLIIGFQTNKRWQPITHGESYDGFPGKCMKQPRCFRCLTVNLAWQPSAAPSPRPRCFLR